MSVPEKIQKDVDKIIDSCTGVGNIIDELTLLRISIRAYLDGADADEAVAFASKQLSDSLTNSKKE